MTKQKIKPDLPALADAAILMNRLKSESDRGAALMAAAWVDDSLTELIKANLVQNRALINEVFAAMGPLGTFAAKIKMAYLLGVIVEDVYQDLNTIRAIRNAFAHVRAPLHFTEQTTKRLCQSLVAEKLLRVSLEDVPSPREAYVQTASFLTSFFMDEQKPTAAIDKAMSYSAYWGGYRSCRAHYLKKDSPELYARLEKEGKLITTWNKAEILRLLATA